MKKLFYLVALFIVIFSFKIAFAFDTSDTGWVIKNYDAIAYIQDDQQVNLEEIITVDFRDLQNKHGIFRYVPYSYIRDGQSYKMRIKVLSVTNQNNEPVNYKAKKTLENLELKIGSADFTVSGEQIYKINYEINRAINSFDSYDEFYWNVTGTDWPVPIENSKVEVNWPDGSKVTQNKCFTGFYGSTDENCDITENDNKVTLTTNTPIEPGQGFTIVSGIEKGVMTSSMWKNIGWFLEDNWGYFLPLFVLYWLIANFNKNGRDPEGSKTIAPEFGPPDKIRPAVMGTVIDEKVDTKDISAVIVDLAVRGFLTIKELKEKKIFGITFTDYEFIDTGKVRTELKNYEKKIIEGIFDGNKIRKLSDLRDKFYKHMSGIKDDLYEMVVKEKDFDSKPYTLKITYLIIGIVIAIGGFFVMPYLIVSASSFVSLSYGLIISGIMIVIFSFFMAKRTEEGVEMTRKIKGFELYMKTAERYRQKFNEDQKIFEKFLPYAMVFGITKEWAKKFEKMQLDRPEWYQGSGAFYPIIFADSLSSMQNSVNSAMVSAPSSAGSGGSGFSGGGSGGGFGGGGGGSW